MNESGRRSRIPAVVAVVLFAFGQALAQGTPPWETPGHAYHGNSVGYARHMWQRYRDNRAEVTRLRGEIQDIRDYNSPYTAVGGLSGGLGIATDDPGRVGAKVRLEARVLELEQERVALEQEWAQWCEWGLRLGPLSDSNETIDDPYLDKSVFPAAIKYEKRDKIDYRIRHFLENVDPPNDVPLPDDLGEIEDAGGAVLVPSGPSGSLRAGEQIMSQGGSFPGTEDDQDIKVGPFDVPQACTIKAHIVATPPVPGVWSLYNSNTGMLVIYERRLGSGYVAGSHVLSLGGQMENNEHTGEADLPGPGRLTVIFGHPRGSGPLMGGNFAQGFNGNIVVTKVATEVPSTARTKLREGDRVRAGGQRTSIRLPDGSHLIIEPNSEVSFSRAGPGVVRVNLERGKCRITRWGARGPHGVVAAVRGRVITPKGTDFILTDSEQGGSVEVIEGAVSVPVGAAEVEVNAGQRMELGDGKITTFDAATVPPALIYGLPPSVEGMDDRTPQPYGEVSAAFTGDRVGEGWLWEDPDQDVRVQTPEPGMLQITVPNNNDMVDNWWGAPRLLHKATGDFDLEGELLISTRANNWVSAEFLVKSPGSYIGYRQGQWPLDGTGAHYWSPGLCWGFGEGNLRKLIRLNESALYRGVDAPDHPIRFRMTRRDRLWNTYWSLDGRAWNLFGTQEMEAPETVFVGWLLKRLAHDGLREEPGVFTLRDIRLHTEPLALGALPEWDAFCLNGQVKAKGLDVELALDGSGPGEARVFSGGWLTGDFDVAVGYDAGQWTAQPGETRVWAVGATTGDEKSLFYIAGKRNDEITPQRIYTDVCNGGSWGAYQWVNSEEKTGRFRLVRKAGVVSTFYETPEGWKALSESGRKIEQPLHLMLEANNLVGAKTHVPFRVAFTVEKVTGPRGGGGKPGTKPGSQPDDRPGPVKQPDDTDNPTVEAIRLADNTASQPLGADYARDNFRFVFVVNMKEGGTVVDTVGLNAAPVGSFNLRVADDGTVSFAIYDPGSQSEIATGNGWHILAVKNAIEARKNTRVAIGRKGGELALMIGPAATAKTATATLATPLSGEPAFLGDFPGDEQRGAGHNIHQGMIGGVQVIKFGG